MKIFIEKVKSIALKPMLGSRLFKNMSWLFVLNFSNKIIPFFTFPYITRIFLPEGFGIITFSLAFISYFQIFIDYGFNLTGARKAATVENEVKKLSRLYTTITVTKFLFFLISVPLILIITRLNAKLFEYNEIILIFILLALSHVIMPVWLFQGLQRVRNMTIISLSVRVVFMISVFTLIKSPEDLQLYALLYSASFLIIGIVSMIVVKTQLKIGFCKINYRDIIEVIKEGFHVFTSSAVITFMGSTGIFVLGLFYLAEYSGLYAAITKINQVVTMFFYPIGLAIFPYHSKKYTVSFKDGFYSVVRIAKVVIPIFLFISIIIVSFRELIVLLILGRDFLAGADLLILLAFLPFLSIVSNFMGTQILVASGHTKEYSRAFLRGALVSILLYFILGYFFGIWGVAIAAIIGECFSLLMLYNEVKHIVKSERK